MGLQKMETTAVEGVGTTVVLALKQEAEAVAVVKRSATHAV